MTTPSDHPGSPPTPPSADWLDGVYEQLRGLAADLLNRERAGHTLQPTALVHEAWIKIAQGSGASFRDATHFRATVARSMRQILVDHARRRLARKRGGDRMRVALEDVPAPGTDAPVDLIELDAAMIGLEQLDARKSRVVELRFFGGLTCEEIAGILSISPKTAEADWYMARAWLRSRLAQAG